MAKKTWKSFYMKHYNASLLESPVTLISFKEINGEL